jgi:hypothetical protein
MVLLRWQKRRRLLSGRWCFRRCLGQNIRSILAQGSRLFLMGVCQWYYCQSLCLTLSYICIFPRDYNSDEWNRKVKSESMHYTTIDDPRKDKDSNPRHALHNHWIPKSQRFEPTPMHYTTIDPKMSKIRTHDNALHHHWSQKIKIRTQDHALHHHWWPPIEKTNMTMMKTDTKLVALRY